MKTYTFTEHQDLDNGLPVYLPDGLLDEQMGPKWLGHYKRNSDGKMCDYYYRLPLDDDGLPISSSDGAGGSTWESGTFGC